MNSENPKRRYLRFSLAFLAIIFLVAGGIAAYGAYKKTEGEKNIQRIVDGLKREEEKLYQQQLADTYGGTTPQETLRMYIDAVEKGDYELASKYFVIERREKWKEELMGIAQVKKISNFLTPLYKALKSRGEYSEKGDTYSIHDPVLISFFRYPSGIWKINEI